MVRAFSLLAVVTLSLAWRAVPARPDDKPPMRSSAANPIIWADVPDPAIIRVGDTYYMSSTTMHMSPGLPIMKSRDYTAPGTT